MGDLRDDCQVLSRIARPVEFDSGGTHVRYPHSAVSVDSLQGQHPIRSWEYTQALRAYQTWLKQAPHDMTALPRIADIGAASSYFYKALKTVDSGVQIDLVDPNYPTPDGQRGLLHTAGEQHVTRAKYDLAEWAAYNMNVETYDAVFCLSVLEHVDKSEVPTFLRDLRSLVKPGGLLVLTCDLAPSSPDVFHFHWMRAGWCPTPAFLIGVVSSMVEAGFPLLAPEYDWTYRGAVVYDYSVASLAFRRKE